MKEEIQKFMDKMPEVHESVQSLTKYGEYWRDSGVTIISEKDGDFLIGLPKGANAFCLSKAGVEKLRDFCNRHLERVS